MGGVTKHELPLRCVDCCYLVVLCGDNSVLKKCVIGGRADYLTVYQSEISAQKVPVHSVRFVGPIPVFLLSSCGHVRQIESADVETDRRETQQDLQAGVQH